MPPSSTPSRRTMLIGAGCGVLGAAFWWAGREGPKGTRASDQTFIDRQSRAQTLRWPDLRPVSPQAEARALRERIEARRRGELGLPLSPGRGAVGAPDGGGLSGIRSHESAVASDWVDGAALDTSPGADAPFVVSSGRKPGADELVAELHGRLVSLPGYAVPLDGDLRGVKAFLLAPYVGACIHVPPPPPNQIVLVAAAEPYSFTKMFEPIQVVGEMRVEPASSQLADVGYQIRNALIRPLEADDATG